MIKPSYIGNLLQRLVLLFLLGVGACTTPPPAPPTAGVPTSAPATANSPSATPSPTSIPPRLLTICLGQEPESLFLYADQSLAANSVREAIYDGPFDLVGFDVQPVILEKKPSLVNGDALLEAVEVGGGEIIMDAGGKFTTLGEGVLYYPAGCSQADCAVVYSGNQPVLMDQLVVRFKLKAGLLWSDGAPLTAADSQYSFQVASALYPRYRPALIQTTASYQALDALTVEWRGVPGYRDPQYPTNFFSPLPQHAWGGFAPEQLLVNELPRRMPLGWGAYQIEEWTPGDHIRLRKNSYYFRAAEGLPAFDQLVFRFVPAGEEALAALLAGECDLVDKSALSEVDAPALGELERTARLKVIYERDAAWEHLDFNLAPLSQPDPLAAAIANRDLRQAMAACLDRSAIAASLFGNQSEVPVTYVPSSHPLFNPEAPEYPFDPQTAGAKLTLLGWIDHDNHTETPRLAQGVPGVPDGIPLQFSYLTIDGATRQRAAELVRASLAQCGIQIDLQLLSAEQLFAPGPEGVVFGRQFTLAQFGWETSFQPPCFLYTQSEIPGQYPQHPKGWGGANATGYSNPEFDQACRTALATLPDQNEHRQAHLQAQAIFAQDLPAIPLYTIPNRLAMRVDMCGVVADAAEGNAMFNIEGFNYGEACNLP